jgi:hypothetical protein
MTTILSQAAPKARKALNFAAPALVVGMILVSQAQGRITYPTGPAGVLERSVDAKLAKEVVDIRVEKSLLTSQTLVAGQLAVLNAQLSHTTDPARKASLQRQIDQKTVQFQQIQRSIDRNAIVLRGDLNVLNPVKDQQLRTLHVTMGNRRQVDMFVAAAALREANYVAIIRAFLRAHPATPSQPF